MFNYLTPEKEQLKFLICMSETDFVIVSERFILSSKREKKERKKNKYLRTSLTF